MKILIAHASAGAGHQKAAEAIFNAFTSRRSGHDVRLVDVLDQTSDFFRLSYKEGYSLLIHKAIYLWDLAFWFTEAKITRDITRVAASFINRWNTLRFRKLLIREKFDLVISTHFLTSEIAASLKVKGIISSAVVTVITDYGAHPFWVSKGTDYYFVASNFTGRKLLEQGVEGEKIKILGIPVDDKFLVPQDKIRLREKLGIARDAFCVLVMTGSFGMGPIEEIVEAIHNEIQLLVVCARNKKLYSHLKKKNYPNCLVYGFADNVQELMAAADVIITKPGGLTISEVLAMGIPPIFIAAIPGQETVNQEMMSYYGVGAAPGTIAELKEIVFKYKNSPQDLRRIKDNIDKVKKPHAAEEICDVICQGGLRFTC